MHNIKFEEQSINMEGVCNARELGGYEMEDGRVIRRGLLLRTGGLATATDADIKRLEDVYNVAHIFDFRTKTEVMKAPDRGVRNADNINLPSNDPEKEGEWRASALAQVAHNNDMELLLTAAQTEETKNTLNNMYPSLILSEYTQLQFATFLNYAARTENGAILWHCSQGKDRTGWGAAFLLSALGASRELLIEDFDVSNIFYQEQVEELVEKLRQLGGKEDDFEVIRGFIGVSKKNFIDTLDLIDREFGSMDDYLVNQLCLSKEEQLRMREIFLE